MDLHVYNGEKFNRNSRRYVGFSSVFIICIALSILNQNIVGAIILFFILGAYFYYSILSNQETKIRIEDEYVLIDKRSHPRTDFTGYTIEIDKKTSKTQNIVFIYSKGYLIYTIKDTDENMKLFSKELDQHIPLVGSFDQSLLEKIIRLLKL